MSNSLLNKQTTIKYKQEVTMKKLPLAIAVSAAILSSNVMAELAPLNFNGYMRAGVGIGTESGANPKHEVAKIGRLGNENDFYTEFGFKKEVYNEGGVSFLVDSMLNSWAAPDDNGSLNASVAQFNIQAKGLFDFDKEAVLWAGQRYYQRQDIHITDFYYWNTSGIGGGIEQISMGPGKLSLALIQSEDAQAADDYVASYTADIRYAGLSLWNNASLELGFNYNYGNEKNEQTIVADDGLMLTAVLNQGFGQSSSNKTVVQYGTSSYAADMVNYGGGTGFNRSGDNNDGTGFRIINTGTMTIGENIEFGHQLLFGSATDVSSHDIIADDVTTWSAVIRPMYKWDDHMRTIVELGTYADEVDDEKYASSKFTVAQAWAAGSGFYARPEIRLYASYIADHEGDAGTGALNGAESEISVGIQAEAWW